MDLRIWFGAQHVGRKNWEILIGGKVREMQCCNVETVLKGRRLYLGHGVLTLDKMCVAWALTLAKRESGDADPRPFLKGRSLGLATLTPFLRVGTWDLRVGGWNFRAGVCNS